MKASIGVSIYSHKSLQMVCIPEKRSGDCGMILGTFLKSVSPNLPISQALIKIRPLSISTIRNNALSMLDFPAPVLPTITSFSLGGTVNDNSCRTGGSSGL